MRIDSFSYSAGPQFGVKMAKKIYFDGLNLALRKGDRYHDLHEGIGSDHTRHWISDWNTYYDQRAPARDAQMREIDFFDHPNNYHSSRLSRRLAYVADHIKYKFAARQVRLDLQGIVVTSTQDERLVPADHYFCPVTYLVTPIFVSR